ncbi:MAG: DUF4386 family protein [Gaiellaceae bacterium]
MTTTGGEEVRVTEVGANRLTGICAVLFLPLILVGFGAIVGFSPSIEDDATAISDYYADLGFGRAVVGEWLELLAFVALLVFAAGFVHLIRQTEAAWLGWLALAAAATLCGAVVTGIAPLVALAYLGDHGAVAPEQSVVLNALRVASHWFSTVFAATWMLGTAAAVLATRPFPRWLGWGGLAVGLLMLFSVVAPLTGVLDLGQMLMGLWLLIAGALLLARPRPSADPAVA